jgi:hypothetical protein
MGCHSAMSTLYQRLLQLVRPSSEPISPVCGSPTFAVSSLHVVSPRSASGPSHRRSHSFSWLTADSKRKSFSAGEQGKISKMFAHLKSNDMLGGLLTSGRAQAQEADERPTAFEHEYPVLFMAALSNTALSISKVRSASITGTISRAVGVRGRKHACLLAIRLYLPVIAWPDTSSAFL